MSRGRSVSNSSSSSSADSEGRGKEFRELETARRWKELKDRHSLPTKSILKKHWDSEDSRVIHTEMFELLMMLTTWFF